MAEIDDDPTYGEEIIPWAVDLIGPVAGRFLDLGCGEGQLLRAVAAQVSVGCDVTATLLEQAASDGVTVQCRLPDLGWIRDGSIEAAACVLVLEHLTEASSFFDEVRRVLEPGGALTLITNHPAYTAGGAGPVIDLSDGEVLWRWGAYFTQGTSHEPAGGRSVAFHHRPMGELLNSAARNGLYLEVFQERGLSPRSVARDPGLAGQEHFPRLLGVRWRAHGDSVG